MDQYWQHVKESHFAWGLAVGLFFVALVWISGIFKRGELRKEVRRLREHLHTQMDITSKGNSVMLAENTALKQQNENLRVAVKEWQTKPGRAEMRMLAVYDRAVRILNQNAPGFSPVWEKAVKESEQELVASESGVGSMLRRAFQPFAALGNGGGAKPASASAFDDAAHGHPAGPVVD